MSRFCFEYEGIEVDVQGSEKIFNVIVDDIMHFTFLNGIIEISQISEKNFISDIGVNSIINHVKYMFRFLSFDNITVLMKKFENSKINQVEE